MNAILEPIRLLVNAPAFHGLTAEVGVGTLALQLHSQVMRLKETVAA